MSFIKVQCFFVGIESEPDRLRPPPDSEAMALAAALGEASISTAESSSMLGSQREAAGNDAHDLHTGAKSKVRLEQASCHF